MTSALPSAEFAQAIVETVRTPLLVLDADHRIVMANPAFRDRYGRGASEVVGSSLFEIDGGAWDVPELRASLEKVLPKDRETRDLEVQVAVGETEPRTLLVDARRVRFEGHESELILVSAEDITERVEYERRIEEYARELKRSNEDLESFAHAASHDLQEPLRKIRTYADRITSLVDAETLGERGQRYLERMPQAVERMQLRIDDLLKLARMGREEPTRRPTDLNQVLDAVLADLETSLAESGGHVEVGPLPTVHADPAQMQLLFQNLVANGLKFSKEGQPATVRVRSVAPEAREAGTTDEDEPESSGGHPGHRVVVEDDGIGFEQEYSERIFTPFQRLHGRAEFEGNGVGLAICRRIVEAHDGRIDAEGRSGLGARFHVVLPPIPDEESPR